MKRRPFCKVCSKNFAAKNYKKNGVDHYRSKCHSCMNNKKSKKTRKYNWELSGYKKKPACDVCGFKSLYNSQTVVYHIDGDLTNVNLSNLRTVCLNCIEVVKRKEVNWRRGDLTVDY